MAVGTVAAFLAGESSSWGQLQYFTATKLRKALEEQAAQMEGKEFTWKESLASMGGSSPGPSTVSQFQFDAKGMLLNGTPTSGVLKYRSEGDFYVLKSDPAGPVYAHFAAKGGRLANVDYRSKVFIHSQQMCTFRTNTIEFPMLRILGVDGNPRYSRDGKKPKWTLKKLPPDKVELTVGEENRPFLRATFLFPSLMCLSLEQEPGSNVAQVIRAVPGAVTVEGFPFLPSAFRREATSGGIQYVSTSQMESVKPLDPASFPPFEAPVGFDMMSSSEYWQKMRERSLQRRN